ncbi:hypothetical protein [Kamptonema formosum]|uniref:hypothetical protein n=1 Tax=Kamptonema formosum TaxID=331992 RepID=UPI0012DCF7A3|nr:hypothetical protein [Oscillatoria sp. PCC 10802]
MLRGWLNRWRQAGAGGTVGQPVGGGAEVAGAIQAGVSGLSWRSRVLWQRAK